MVLRSAGQVRVGQLARRELAARAGRRPSRGRGGGSGRSSSVASRLSRRARRGSAAPRSSRPSLRRVREDLLRPAGLGATTSSRRMFSSSIVWAVGAMCSVSSWARTAYWSRMWLSWPSRRASSSSVRPRRARWATCSTSLRDSVAIGPMIADRPATGAPGGRASRRLMECRTRGPNGCDGPGVPRFGILGPWPVRPSCSTLACLQCGTPAAPRGRRPSAGAAACPYGTPPPGRRRAAELPDLLQSPSTMTGGSPASSIPACASTSSATRPSTTATRRRRRLARDAARGRPPASGPLVCAVRHRPPLPGHRAGRGRTPAPARA